MPIAELRLQVILKTYLSKQLSLSVQVLLYKYFVRDQLGFQNQRKSQAVLACCRRTDNRIHTKNAMTPTRLAL